MTTTRPPRRRDAAGTRHLLLEAARNRFTHQGYAATTVREIADDAGVNVALISRYFTSKEGLFRACLTGAIDELGRTVEEDVDLEQVARRIAAHLAGGGPHPGQIVLLLRSSGDPGADQVRRDVLRTFAERLADRAGGTHLLLRAQIVIAATLGIALLRSTTAAVEPLASAGEDELAVPLSDLVSALLTVSGTP